MNRDITIDMSYDEIGRTAPQRTRIREEAGPGHSTGRLIVAVALSFSIMTLGMFVTPSMLTADIVDKVVAVVEDEVITLYDLKKSEAAIAGQYGSPRGNDPTGKGSSEYRERLIEQLVVNKLMEKEADAMNIEVTAEDVDQAIENVTSAPGFSRESLLSALEAEGIPFDEYRKEMENNLRLMRLVSIQVHSKVDVSEERLIDHYYNHKKDYYALAGTRLGHIFIPFRAIGDDEAELEAAKGAEEVIDRFRDGEPFAPLAREYSTGPEAREGGDLGYVDVEKLQSAFRDVVTALEEGEISDPLWSAQGYHLLAVSDRRDEGYLSFEDVREEIFRKISERETEKRFKEWIEELKETTYIEVNP